MAGAERNLQPQCEDYYSDSDNAGGHVVAESFSRNSSPVAQANVSTKRSKDLKTDKAPAAEKMPTNIDLRSDSGYSSFTAASKSSADSAPSATSRSPPVVHTSTTNTTTAPPVSQSPAPKPRRPTGGDSRQHSNESSPRQKPARTASVSSKQRPAGLRRPTLQGMRDNGDEECRDPNCTTCGPNAVPHQRRRPELPPSASSNRIPTYTPSDQMSQRSAPDPYYSPPSPTYTRQAPPYASQGPAVVQTARTRRSSSVSRPRPQSFAGDASAGYWAGMMGASAYPSPPQEHGPPPSFSAYQNRMPNMQYGTQGMPPYMGAPPPGNYYGHPGQQYDAQQRPPPSARTASNYSQRGHAPPIVTQEDPGLSKYSARYNHSQPSTPSEHHTRNPSLQQRKPLQLTQYPVAGQDEASESEYTESEEEYDQREVSRRVREAKADRVLMPPPKMKRDQSQRRPPLAHAKTSQAVERLEADRREQRRQSIVIPDRSVQAGRERERTRPTAAPARRASVSRPPPPHRSTQSEYNTRQARVVVNDSRHNRRQSAYQSYEKAYDDYVRAQAVDDQYNAERKREKRASRIVVQEPRYVPGQFNVSDDDDEEEEEEEPVRVRALSRPRRKTESDSRKGKERTTEIKQKANDAEEYINSTRGSRVPYADQVNKSALKRVSRVSQPSESGSSNSNGSGNRTTMTSTTNNEIRLRVDGTMPLSLQLSGDMEGRTLQLVPAENGMTDLVIGGGNTRSEGTVYRSEKSVSGGNKAANRRSIVAGQGRRDIEDASERSSRSARSRRDRDEIREVRDERERGHVLRRSRTTAYH